MAEDMYPGAMYYMMWRGSGVASGLHGAAEVGRGAPHLLHAGGSKLVLARDPVAWRAGLAVQRVHHKVQILRTAWGRGTNRLMLTLTGHAPAQSSPLFHAVGTFRHGPRCVRAYCPQEWSPRASPTAPAQIATYEHPLPHLVLAAAVGGFRTHAGRQDLVVGHCREQAHARAVWAACGRAAATQNPSLGGLHGYGLRAISAKGLLSSSSTALAIAS